ncbi:response regulator transcription factor [Ancylobacter pratisalsi]|uniref:Response regulator transcription factor n=1 Tax=Ancylobacter pratisalsi TaxID=1745854 RepID=A0A6P1YJ53_9HYPH|nr:response regulator transcription factor [Ancylobacter pratisalsi]QIB32726.1 response regulator transcription factor [Ancylobacter pratisalsi]
MMHSVERRDIILVVDDSPETLSLLTDALEAAGATVLVAVEGANALALVERITPDVILLDAVMPGMDGFETCRRLKRNKSVAHVPVIFMTGLSETEQIVKGLEAGGVDYVTKPISPDELIARIRVHLANARQTHSARAALDAAGRFLLSATPDGRVLWSTPQATALLTAITASPAGDSLMLPDTVRRWLSNRRSETSGIEPNALELPMEGSPLRHRISYVGQIGPEELLLRIVEDDGLAPEQVLKARLNLTIREAEVLMWLARGKANRDIGEILGLSPRTVNKHLEQIYSKIGVENRAAATALAVTALTPK